MPLHEGGWPALTSRLGWTERESSKEMSRAPYGSKTLLLLCASSLALLHHLQPRQDGCSPPSFSLLLFLGEDGFISGSGRALTAFSSRLRQKELDPCPQPLLVIRLSRVSPPPASLLLYGAAAAAEQGVRSQGKDNLTDGAQVAGSAQGVVIRAQTEPFPL